MAKRRTVVRKYYSKKQGKMVTKIYTYEHPSKKGLTLVDKRGRIMHKNIERFKQTIIDNTDYNEAQKRTLLADLEAYVEVRHDNKKKLTTQGFLGHQESDAITRFLTNAGYSIEEFAEEADVDIEDVVNPDNWHDNFFIAAGRTFKFNWTYTGSFFEEV